MIGAAAASGRRGDELPLPIADPDFAGPVWSGKESGARSGLRRRYAANRGTKVKRRSVIAGIGVKERQIHGVRQRRGAEDRLDRDADPENALDKARNIVATLLERFVRQAAPIH